MKISDFSIRRNITTIMIILLVVLLGFISMSRLSIDLLPSINFPGAAIVTEYSGVSPEEVESLVTKPLENSISTVTNIKSITSTSNSGQSIIVAEFNWDTDMDFAALDMREKIDLVKGYLPEDAEEPLIFQFDPSMIPIIQYGVSSGKDLAKLKKEVENDVIPELERLEGVASVNLVGGLDKQILIELDQSKMDNYGISFSTVTRNLMLENLNLTGGEVIRGNKKLLVRTTGKFKGVGEIRDILIPNATNKGYVKLEDIATVKDTYKEVKSIARVNGNPSIGLTIQKQTDANTVKVANRVKDKVDYIKDKVNGGLNFVAVADQSEYIEKSIFNVRNNAIIGGILAVIILFLFLRNVRSTIIIALAIPISVVTTFLLIYFGGLTINIISLGGLALGIGMVVDNSIVVLENIYRFRQEGLSRMESARKGSNEVGMAIAASTFTTIMVFLPVIFVEGLASQLFKELALTVSFSLFASLLVALTLVPMLSSRILKVGKDHKKTNNETGFIKKFYKKSLRWSLNHRFLVVVFLVVLLAVSVALVPLIGTEFLPNFDQGEFSISYKLPVGTVLEETNSIAHEIEEEVRKIPEVDTVYTNIGVAGQMNTQQASETGSILVRLVGLSKRDRSTSEVMEELRNKINIPDTQVNIETNSSFFGPSGGKPISIKVEGDNLDTLERLAAEIGAEMKEVKGVREVEDSFGEGRPEFLIEVDRSIAARLGLRVTQIASSVKTAISGDVATTYEVAGEEYDVKVRLQKNDRENIEQIQNLNLVSATGAKVPLTRVAEFKYDTGPKEILRDNQVRYAEITASLYQMDLGTAVNNIKERLNKNIDLPSGYEIKYGGQFQDLQESFTSLGFAFLLSLVLVYMVMASQFESLIHPFVIMFTVPMALIGVILGLYITGSTLSVPAVIGVITLAGIVVNNAIVLVDYINTLRRKGKNKFEAILKAGPVRLRPIMMTALTTVLGLTPLALGIGEGSELEAPIAIVIIGGLLFSTILTLYIIPVMYSLLTGLTSWVKTKFGSQSVSG